MNKQVDVHELTGLCEQYRKTGQVVVFTNGCFDILHAGHVTYLDKARSFGDRLVLGLNSDQSVKQIKGEKRPVIHQEHRAMVLSALSCIDHIVIFDEPDPGRLIQTICPDILVKGADWPEDQIIGADFVKQRGGKVERVVLEPEISTTRIIERIGQLYYEN